VLEVRLLEDPWVSMSSAARMLTGVVITAVLGSTIVCVDTGTQGAAFTTGQASLVNGTLVGLTTLVMLRVANSAPVK
jgi:hypothetical protein